MFWPFLTYPAQRQSSHLARAPRLGSCLVQAPPSWLMSGDPSQGSWGWSEAVEATFWPYGMAILIDNMLKPTTNDIQIFILLANDHWRSRKDLLHESQTCEHGTCLCHGPWEVSSLFCVCTCRFLACFWSVVLDKKMWRCGLVGFGCPMLPLLIWAYVTSREQTTVFLRTSAQHLTFAGWQVDTVFCFLASVSQHREDRDETDPTGKV